MKAKLILETDHGASRTKTYGRYEVEDGTVKEFFQTSCAIVRKLIEPKYRSQQYLADNNNALVSFDKSYWLVGDAARGETLTLIAGQPKSETAIAKVLATVGRLVCELKGVGVDEIELVLGLLLPLDEMVDRANLQVQLEQVLWEFEYNGSTVRTVLSESVHISPEGYGMSRLITAEQGKVLVFGHRDVSIIHVENGSIIPSKSQTLAGWGMHKLIKDCEYIFKDELTAAGLIFAAAIAPDRKAKLQYLKRMARTDTDVPRLQAALNEARSQVWSDLSLRFQPLFQGGIQQLICSGGNACFWMPQIQKLFTFERFGCEPNFADATIAEIEQRFPRMKGSPYTFRSADDYLSWLKLSGIPEFKQLIEVLFHA
jgi:hypothetical protein